MGHRLASLLAIASVVGLGACKSKREPPRDVPPPPPARDAAVVPVDAAGPWPELADLPRVEPERVISLPTRPDVPRFDVGGPVLAGDLAIVSSSQFGFAAVDWRRGTIAWTRPAGIHVAPPLVVGSNVVLVGGCLTPPAIPDSETLLGCLRVVSPTGADQAYFAIRAKTSAVEAFAASAGAQSLWPEGERAVRWRRGDAAVTIDLLTGIARPASATPPPLVVTYKDRTWEVTQDDGRIVARQGKRIAWQTEHPYSAVLGTVWLPDSSPLLRVINFGARGDSPTMHLMDMDATGSLRAAVARPLPGISLLGWGLSSIGDAALAVRMDRSIQRDFIAGYAANAMLMWVYPLPEVPRADPVGVVVAPARREATANPRDARELPGAVIVFHDGDTLTILPELLAPPTAPGAGRAPSENPTP